jgi:hypothetical protein
VRLLQLHVAQVGDCFTIERPLVRSGVGSAEARRHSRPSSRHSRAGSAGRRNAGRSATRGSRARPATRGGHSSLRRAAASAGRHSESAHLMAGIAAVGGEALLKKGGTAPADAAGQPRNRTVHPAASELSRARGPRRRERHTEADRLGRGTLVHRRHASFHAAVSRRAVGLRMPLRRVEGNGRNRLSNGARGDLRAELRGSAVLLCNGFGGRGDRSFGGSRSCLLAVHDQDCGRAGRQRRQFQRSSVSFHRITPVL